MRRLSDLPPVSRVVVTQAPKVVTLGGGHGQATLLRALSKLDCDISAVVSVADDGGCSGKLREELGMPPPGDARRCLVSLAAFEASAARFEERLRGGDEEGRCVGNLVLAEMRQDLGNLQSALDWAGALLGCVGRVIPAAEVPGTLNVYDLVHGPLAGEVAIERLKAKAIVANVEGPERASPEATKAIEEAELIFMGPGSFIGSTLAVLTTADIAAAIARSAARRILVRNLTQAEHDGDAIAFEEQERLVRDHLVIGSGGEQISFDVLAHDPDRTRRTLRADGSLECASPLAAADDHAHDPELLAIAIGAHYDLGRRPRREAPTTSTEAQQIFERYLASARVRLAKLKE